MVDIERREIYEVEERWGEEREREKQVESSCMLNQSV